MKKLILILMLGASPALSQNASPVNPAVLSSVIDVVTDQRNAAQNTLAATEVARRALQAQLEQLQKQSAELQKQLDEKTCEPKAE